MGPIPWSGSVTSDQLATGGRDGFVVDVVSDAALVWDVLREGVPTFGVAPELTWVSAAGPVAAQAERSTAPMLPITHTHRL